jgi:hypothetical protein
MAIRDGRCQFMLGLAGENVFRGKEAGKVLPDDFLRGVSKDPLSPRVPADQIPFEPHQKNGVFLRIHRQQLKPLAELVRR